MLEDQGDVDALLARPLSPGDAAEAAELEDELSELLGGTAATPQRSRQEQPATPQRSRQEQPATPQQQQQRNWPTRPQPELSEPLGPQGSVMG